MPLTLVAEQDEAAEGHVVGLDLATGEPLDPVTLVLAFWIAIHLLRTVTDRYHPVRTQQRRNLGQLPRQASYDPFFVSTSSS